MAVTDEAPGRPASEVDQPNFFKRLQARLHANRVTGLVTKIVVTLVGVAVICAGLVMMVAPGPGIVAVIVGLGILATEYDWADRWVQAAKRKAQQAADKARQMDPAVRRRRIIATAAVTLVVGGALLVYLVTYDWPAWSVEGWDWVQGLVGAVPDLPGM